MEGHRANNRGPLSTRAVIIKAVINDTVDALIWLSVVRAQRPASPAGVKLELGLRVGE